MAYDLKKLRDKHRISQEYMAKKFDVSRPTYIQIEKGEKEMTVSQMKKLFELFGSDFTGTTSAKLPQTKRKFTPKPDLYKFKETLLYILSKIGAKPHIGETALFKILYFIDFDFYEKYEKTFIGATYIKNYYGPTPKQFKKIADEMIAKGELEQVKSKYFQYDQRKYLPLRESKLDTFSVVEIKHIDDVLARLSDRNASELSVYSHEDTPWQVTENHAEIDYNLVFHRSAPYAQHDYDEMMRRASGHDILKELGPISDEEYNYYENL